MRAQLPLRTPTFGGGEEDASDLAHGNTVGGSQVAPCATMTEGVDYLRKLREKKGVVRRIREDVYNDMLLAFTTDAGISLGFTINPIAGRESLKVAPLCWDRQMNSGIEESEDGRWIPGCNVATSSTSTSQPPARRNFQVFLSTPSNRHLDYSMFTSLIYPKVGWGRFSNQDDGQKVRDRKVYFKTSTTIVDNGLAMLLPLSRILGLVCLNGCYSPLTQQAASLCHVTFALSLCLLTPLSGHRTGRI